MIRYPATWRWTICAAGLLALAACSTETDPTTNEAEHVADLFASGFEADDETSGADEKADGESTEMPAANLLAYRADSSVRREIANLLADNLNRNFSLRFRMDDPERFLRSGAATDVGERMIEALGLPKDTVAGATVLMFGLAWELANEQALEPADQKALLGQASTMLDDHEVSGRGDEARQREGDIRLMTAALWLEEARLRRGDAAAMRELSDAVVRDMQRMTGNDMRAHRITDKGFVDR